MPPNRFQDLGEAQNLRRIIRFASRSDAEAAVARLRLSIPSYRNMVRREMLKVRSGQGDCSLLGIAWFHYRDQQRRLRLWSRKLKETEQ